MSRGLCKNECSGPKCPYESRRGIGKIDSALAKLYRFCCKCRIYFKCEDKYCFCCSVPLRIYTHDNYQRKPKKEIQPMITVQYVEATTPQRSFSERLPTSWLFQREWRVEGLPHGNILKTL